MAGVRGTGAGPRRAAETPAAAEKAPGKKAAVKKAPVKKAAVTKAAVKKAPAQKAPVKKAPAQKAPVKKAPAQKAPVKKAAVTKAPAQKAPVKKAPVKKAAAELADPKPGGKAEASDLSVAGLTAAELAEIRDRLQDELDELRLEYDRSLIQLNELRQQADGSGDDQADAGNKTFEREQEESIAANRRQLLTQIEHAIERIDSGVYGLCEDCGRPIPHARLKALPVATLDAQCKARAERR